MGVTIIKSPIRMALEVSQETYADLYALARTGLFGTDPAVVAEAFIRDRIRECVLEGWLPMASPSRRGRRP